MKTKIFLLLMLICLWAGCSSNEPSTGVILRIKSVSDVDMNARTAAPSIAFNQVMIGVEDLELESVDAEDQDHNEDGDENHHGGEGDDDGDNGGDHHDGEHHGDNDNDNDEIQIEGPFVVDLLAGTSIPDFGVATVPPGLYKEIELSLSPVLPDSNTVFVAFTYVNNAGDTLEVELSTKKEFEIKIKNEDGFQVDANVLNTILVELNLDDLLSGIDLSGATVNENGIIQINDSSNTELLHEILSNFNGSCHAGNDEDHDNDIDDD